MFENADSELYAKVGSKHAQVDKIRIARPPKKEPVLFTSHLSGFCMLGIYVCFASLFF